MKKLSYLILLSAIVLISCKKKTTPDPSSDQTNTVTNPAYYMTFKDGATSVKLEQGVNKIYNGTDYLTQNTYNMPGGVFETFVGFNPVFKGGIYFGKDYPAGDPDPITGYNSFSTGSNSFGNENTSSTGFIIEYLDKNNVYWSSDNGVATQSGSAITISSISAYNSFSSSYKVQGTFNCTVYDGSGNSKTLTNGKFKSMFPYSD